jgi:hypothetical protein
MVELSNTLVIHGTNGAEAGTLQNEHLPERI